MRGPHRADGWSARVGALIDENLAARAFVPLAHGAIGTIASAASGSSPPPPARRARRRSGRPSHRPTLRDQSSGSQARGLASPSPYPHDVHQAPGHHDDLLRRAAFRVRTTPSLASARRCISAWSASRGTVITSRRLPFTCTTSVDRLLDEQRRVVRRPRRCAISARRRRAAAHSSSPRCGAYGASRRRNVCTMARGRASRSRSPR